MTWSCRAAWAVLAAGLIGIAVTAWAKLPDRPSVAAAFGEGLRDPVREDQRAPARPLPFTASAAPHRAFLDR